jgi:site-specific recombinase XerD
MASISIEKNRYSVRLLINNKEFRFRGFTNRREAERFADKLEMLKTARKTGTMPGELAVWVGELEKNSPELYDRIADIGLMEAREESRTLEELLKTHRNRSDVSEATRTTWDLIGHNLIEFFGGEKPIARMTQEEVHQFDQWLRTAPLNRRNKQAVAYTEATANKRIGIAKTIFHYAEKIGWIAKNPFRFLKGGDSTNPEKLEYVPAENLLKVVENSPLRWRVILLFGRFCGLRGSSELYRMEWGDIHLSTAEEKGWIAVRAEKNKHHGRAYRVVPLPTVLESHLVQWMEQALEGEKMVFPGMKKHTNFSVETGKLIAKAGLPVWKNPWYNLRKSFCTDLLPVVKDITTYEQITDHSYAIAAKHYQIMTKGRLATGMEQALQALENIPHTVKQPGDIKEDTQNRVPETVPVVSRKPSERCIISNSVIAQRDSQVPYFYERNPKEKPLREDTRKGIIGARGLEPPTF